MKPNISIEDFKKHLDKHKYELQLEFVKSMRQYGFSLDGFKHKQRKTNRTIRNLTKLAEKERERNND